MAVRGLCFGLLWWILTEGGSPFSVLALLGILSAVALSRHLMPVGSWQFHYGPLLRFGPYFFRQSLLGGADVASRALHPRMDVAPMVITHMFSLQKEQSRVFFLWVVSLLPGTAGVDLQGDKTFVHVLDETFADKEQLRDLEKRIADLFGDGK